MALEFIPLGISALFLAVGVLALFVPKVKSFLKVLPFFRPQMWAIVLVVVGVIAGGVGWYQTALGGMTASIGLTPTTQAGVMPETLIEKCVYLSGKSITGNTTVRADTSDTSVVYLDVDGSDFTVLDDAATTNEVYMNFSCYRTGSIHEDGAVHIVVKSPTFLNEVVTSDSSLYAIIDDSSSMSSVWAGKNQQTIYVGEGGAVTTDTVEEVYLTYSEGEKTLVLGITADLDYASLQRTNNFTMIPIDAYQRLDNGQEVKVARVIINHIP